jgi:hypothetical protein
MTTVNTFKGLMLATAAAGLFLAAGCATEGQPANSSAKVHCEGVNSCKGTGACKSASNNCKGQNACKGKGFLSMTKAECTAAGGKVAA